MKNKEEADKNIDTNDDKGLPAIQYQESKNEQTQQSEQQQQ